MKSNKKLGFKDVCECVSVYYGSHLSLDLFVGERGKQYRAYAYLFFCDQDASKEGIHDETCGRGNDPQEAVQQWAKNAIAGGWVSAPVKKAMAEMLDNIDEES